MLANLARTVARLAALALPFLPGTAESIWGVLAMDGTLGQTRWAALENPAVEGRRVARPPILFPKPNLPAQNVVT